MFHLIQTAFLFGTKRRLIGVQCFSVFLAYVENICQYPSTEKFCTSRNILGQLFVPLYKIRPLPEYLIATRKGASSEGVRIVPNPFPSVGSSQGSIPR